MNPPIQVVAFDCDGVMFDSSEANKAYYNSLLARFDLPPMTSEQFAYSHMHTVDESLIHLFPDEATRKAAHAYRRELGYTSFQKYMKIEPGLVSLLETLRPHYRTAVATNRTNTINRLLADYHIDHLFDLVLGALDVASPKPAPDMLEKVADHFSVSPEAILYIGDSKVDETAANAAGTRFVAYRDPNLDAHHHVRHLSQIVDLLDGKP